MSTVLRLSDSREIGLALSLFHGRAPLPHRVPPLSVDCVARSSLDPVSRLAVTRSLGDTEGGLVVHSSGGR